MVPGSRTHGSGGTTRLHPHSTMKSPFLPSSRMQRPGLFGLRDVHRWNLRGLPIQPLLSIALVLHAQRSAAPRRGGGPGQRAALTSRLNGHTRHHGHSRHAATGTLAATGTHVTPQRTHSPPRAHSPPRPHSPPRALTSRLNGHTRGHGHSRHTSTGTLAATGTHVTPPRAHSPTRAHPLYWIVTDTSCVCPLRSIVMVTVSPAR